MSITRLECRVSEMINGDTCPRPTTLSDSFFNVWQTVKFEMCVTQSCERGEHIEKGIVTTGLGELRTAGLGPVRARDQALVQRVRRRDANPRGPAGPPGPLGLAIASDS
jgi:hypothetical protein